MESVQTPCCVGKLLRKEVSFQTAETYKTIYKTKPDIQNHFTRENPQLLLFKDRKTLHKGESNT